MQGINYEVKGKLFFQGIRRWLLTVILAFVGMEMSASDSLSLYNRVFLDAVVERQKGNDATAFELFKRCTKLNPKAAESYFYLAQYHLKLRNKDQALACFEEASRLEPGNATFSETLAQMYVSSAKYDEAIATFESVFASDASRTDVLEMLFRLYQMEGDYDNAIRTLDRLEVLEDKNEQITLAKSEIYTQKGDRDSAIVEMRSLAEYYPNDLNYKGMYGDILMQNDNDEEALRIFNEILTEEPENNRAQLSLRTFFLKRGETEKADSMTMRILLNKNTTADSRIYLMRQLIAEQGGEDGDSLKVLSCFNAIQESDCRSAEMGLLQVAYMNLVKMPEDSVVRVLESILQFAPDNASASLQLIGKAWEKDDMDRVLQLTSLSSQYNPEEMAFYYFEGMALYKKEDNDGALEAFKKGVSVINEQSNPDIVSDFYSVMGDLYFQKSMKREAFAAYDSCLQWKGDNYGCLNNYAYYLSVNEEQLEKAEQMSFKTVKQEPKNATYLDTYAWVLFKLGRYAEAKVYIEQALQNDSDSTSHVLLEHAGDICAMAGYTDLAMEYWKKALLLTPNDKGIQRKLKHKKYFRQ
ncbi:MAG: tetratricopeptide repeat protein [Prevotella sp.]